jgi:hypothetical protein
MLCMEKVDEEAVSGLEADPAALAAGSAAAV